MLLSTSNKAYRNKPERIVKAAIKYRDTIWVAEPPERHNDILRRMYLSNILDSSKGIQGFLTSHRRFVNRKEAMKIARLQLQLKDPKARESSCELFTEDMW